MLPPVPSTVPEVPTVFPRSAALGSVLPTLCSVQCASRENTLRAWEAQGWGTQGWGPRESFLEVSPGAEVLWDNKSQN